MRDFCSHRKPGCRCS